MDRFYDFMISNTAWNLPVWAAVALMVVLAILRAFWNVIHWFA
jgi:hypothetical protein